MSKHVSHTSGFSSFVLFLFLNHFLSFTFFCFLVFVFYQKRKNTSRGAGLTLSVTKTHEWQIPLDDTVIASAHIRDPYILLQFDNNSMFLLQVVVGINEISLKEIPNADFGEVQFLETPSPPVHPSISDRGPLGLDVLPTLCRMSSRTGNNFLEHDAYWLLDG